jgi:hypothetical protein
MSISGSWLETLAEFCKMQGLKCRTSEHSEEYHGWVDYPAQQACNFAARHCTHLWYHVMH